MSERLEVSVSDLPRGGAYPWLTAVVVPRPIAWVSTVSVDGVVNLAPHSFFTVASAEPPIVSFTCVRTKDSLRNIRATGEFVVNLAPRALADQVNRTGTDYPPDVDELADAGLAAEPSSAVRPPRVAESPVALECIAAGEHRFSDDPQRGSTVVFGRVLHLSVARSVLADDGLPDVHLLAPASRLGRDEWAALGEVFELVRPRYQPPG